MTFFDTFSQKFAQYKRENKKSLKGLKTEAQAKQFLNSRGEDLKQDLEKAVRNKEKIKGAVRKTPSPDKIIFFKELTTRFF